MVGYPPHGDVDDDGRMSSSGPTSLTGPISGVGDIKDLDDEELERVLPPDLGGDEQTRQTELAPAAPRCEIVSTSYTFYF